MTILATFCTGQLPPTGLSAVAVAMAFQALPGLGDVGAHGAVNKGCYLYHNSAYADYSLLLLYPKVRIGLVEFSEITPWTVFGVNEVSWSWEGQQFHQLSRFSLVFIHDLAYKAG